MARIFFSFALLSFLFPFLLVTCNDKETVEYKPMIMQDQMVYQIQGYKLILGNLDKDLNYYSKDEEESTADTETELKKNTNQNYNKRFIQVIVIILFLVTLAGLIISFLKKKNNRVFKILSSIGLLSTLLLLFSIYYEEYHLRLLDKEKTSYTEQYEYFIGIGPGFYLCILCYTFLVYYFFLFVKKYKLEVRKLVDENETYVKEGENIQGN